MTSSDSKMVLDLLERTEANLKRIEIYNKRFVCLSLNEWRYAARHFATYNVTGSEEEQRKALSHLKRAYYDSCDVLIDPKFGSRGFRYCRIANEPVTFPVAGFVRSGT